ncbi:MAG: hypothetical protein Q8P51_08410 [Ignavibacteria bacterium]|nr:hypothetical protein [Ignavibacteria bacterium]
METQEPPSSQSLRQAVRHGGCNNAESKGFSITANKIIQIRRQTFSEIKLQAINSIVKHLQSTIGLPGFDFFSLNFKT